MQKNLKLAGVVFMLAGLGFMAVGGAVFLRAQAGLESLGAVYEAQGIELSYNENGEFVDRGSVDTGNEILSLLKDDWKYPLNERNLDPGDPLVNTSDELMVQFSTISYHVMHGEHTVTLEEDAEYMGEVFEAGEYDVPVDGRYWSDFDRMHPLDSQVRELAWSPLVHGLLAELSAGVSADYLAQFAFFISLLIMGFGGTFAVGGLFMIRASKS